MNKIFKKLLNMIFKKPSTITINGIQYSGKSVELTQNGDKMVIKVDGQEFNDELLKEIKISIDSDSDIGKIESYTDLSVDCKNIYGDVSTMSGEVKCSGNIDGDVSTMSGDVDAHYIRGDVSTMSGDIKKSNKE